MTTCVVCCDTRLTTTRTFTCGACEFVCCKSCVKRFLLDLMDDPQCMQCRRRLTHADLVRELPRTFVNSELKRHREAVLLDRQKAMIPATQDAVDAERRRRCSLKRIRDWTQQREALRQRIREYDQLIHNEYAVLSRRTDHAERRQFVMRCAREGCRGFLSELYKCTVCEGVTCAHCHVFKPHGAEHVCNPDDVATVALLRRDSKRCPACSTWIHRYEGCTQMFCTNPGCHTLFDYRTLRVLGDRDHVHNPHYTEWLAQQRTGRTAARDAADIPCGGMPFVHELHHALVPRGSPALPPQIVEKVRSIMGLHRMVLHVEDVELPRHQTGGVDEAGLAKMRVQFCLGDFDEDVWRVKLQRQDKDRTKKYEISLVLEMVVHACGDLFRQMVLLARAGNYRSVEQARDHVCSVLEHANTALCRIALAFVCSVPFMDMNVHRVVSVSAPMAKQRLAVNVD